MPDRDGWELRKWFVDLRTDDEFREFLRLTGNFDGERLPDSYAKMLANMREWQCLIRDLSRTPRQKWASLQAKYSGAKLERATTGHSLTIFPADKDGAPADIISHTTVGAMLDTVHVEKIEGRRVRWCALEGCLQTFQVSPRSPKKYCCKKHTGVARTRRYRKKLRQKKAKAERLERRKSDRAFDSKRKVESPRRRRAAA